ncbi:hypothetical protein CYMTET_15140 [Cymbomonas tetramitiformis]|uniref:Uncharacterized protein n=1 Tax=Cymbomonas tetramitiformis TaxID=36881 RepID=A0AAE0GG40_9CHLO|nr:hypothetical protein CYMTET_15140 [Cymbomonas tetramitiformis]
MDDFNFEWADDNHEYDADNMNFLERFWYFRMKPKLVFPTEKVVKIMDWRLAILFRGLQAVALSYFVYILVNGQEFLIKEEPSIVLSMYTGSGNASAVQIEQWATQKSARDRGYYRTWLLID